MHSPWHHKVIYSVVSVMNNGSLCLCYGHGASKVGQKEPYSDPSTYDRRTNTGAICVSESREGEEGPQD